MSPERSPSTNRRGFLITTAGTTLATLTGCLSQSPGNTTQRPTGTTTTNTTPRPTESPQTPDEISETTHYRQVEAFVHETTPQEIAEGVLRGEKHLDQFEKVLLERTIAEGTSTFTATTFEPLAERIYVERDGSYYSITRTITDERSVTAHGFIIDSISTCSNTTPPATDGRVAIDELSSTDQRTFVLGLRDHLDDDSCFGGTRTYYYPPNAEANSVFIDNARTLVEYGGDTYVVEHRGTKQATLTTFKYNATLLGKTKAEYAAKVVQDVVWHVDPEVLPDAELTFFEQLIEDGHYEKENPIPEHVDDFLYRIPDNAYAHVENQYFLEYDGMYYRLRYTIVMS